MMRLRKKPEVPAEIIKTDGWYNGLSGYGTYRDKQEASYYLHTRPLSVAEAHALYYTDAIAGRIVDIKVEETFKKGYCIEVEDTKAEEKIKSVAAKISVDSHVQKAETLAGIYGGCGLVMLIPDGLDMAMPVAPNAKGLSGLLHVDARYLKVAKWYDNTAEIHKIGYPEIYRMTSETGLTKHIHESRIVPFFGSSWDLKLLRENQGWSYSALQRPYEALKKFNQAYQTAGGLLADASQAVYKMKGLHDMITGSKKERVSSRMSQVDQNRSSIRAIVLDTEESFERVSTPLSGIPETIDRYFYLLAAAVDIPITKLFGMSPGGMNATGESDMRNFYDKIAAYQSKIVTPSLLQIYSQIAKEFNVTPEKLWIEWEPLYQESEQEKATTKKLKADTDQIYANLGVLDPLEIRLNRFADMSYDSLINPAAVAAALKELTTGTTADLPEQKGLLTASDLASVITVNEARASVGQKPLSDPDGNLTVAEFKAKKEAKGAVQGEQVAVKQGT